MWLTEAHEYQYINCSTFSASSITIYFTKVLNIISCILFYSNNTAPADWQQEKHDPESTSPISECQLDAQESPLTPPQVNPHISVLTNTSSHKHILIMERRSTKTSNNIQINANEATVYPYKMFSVHPKPNFIRIVVRTLAS